MAELADLVTEARRLRDRLIDAHNQYFDDGYQPRPGSDEPRARLRRLRSMASQRLIRRLVKASEIIRMRGN